MKASFNEAQCPFTTLDGHKIQMIKFMGFSHSKLRKLRRSNASLYRYKIHKYQDNINTSYVIFLIEETWNGSFTNGGTMFQVLLTGKKFISVCPVLDNLNGTYIFCCEDKGSCGTITAKVIYYNFGGYLQRVPSPLELVVWKKRFMFEEA